VPLQSSRKSLSRWLVLYKSPERIDDCFKISLFAQTANKRSKLLLDYRHLLIEIFPTWRERKRDLALIRCRRYAFHQSSFHQPIHQSTRATSLTDQPCPHFDQ